MKQVLFLVIYVIVLSFSGSTQSVFSFRHKLEYNDSLITRTRLGSMDYCMHSAFTIRFVLDRNKNISDVKLSLFTPPEIVKSVRSFLENSGDTWKYKWALSTVIKDSLIVFQTISVLSESGCLTEPLYFDSSDSLFLRHCKMDKESEFRAAFFRKRDQRMLLHLWDFDDKKSYYNVQQVVILPSIQIRAAEKF